MVYSMSDVPLGFGLAAKSTQDCRKLDPNAIVVLHQADIGKLPEYLPGKTLILISMSCF